MRGNKASLLALLLLGISLTVQAVSDKERAAIKERIKPVGSVCVEGDQSCGATAAASSGGGARSAEDIYNTFCMACHSTGAAGAPKIGVASDWTARVDQGMEQLYANAIGGINAMPAKGLCMDCSDDELKATIDYLVEKSR